ncbi:interleukin-22 [Pagrus major]|uniref:interleukin-22 n=1 Tax=Pagrus major TaxID=143350 RepID=UPI003CC8788E
MKLATLVSFIRPAVVMLLPLILIGWAEQAAAHPVQQKLSPPLQNPNTYQVVKEVARDAESMNTQNDPSIRLNPRVKTTKQDHMTICCLHANILEFYLNEVLPKHKSEHQRMHTLRTDLSRVSEDLKSHGCNVTRHHHLAVQFRGKLQEMGDEGITKAMGEIDILFTFLQGYCVLPANATDAVAAPADQ